MNENNKTLEAIIIRNYTKLDVWNYLDRAKTHCAYPRCHKKKDGPGNGRYHTITINKKTDQERRRNLPGPRR